MILLPGDTDSSHFIKWKRLRLKNLFLGSANSTEPCPPGTHGASITEVSEQRHFQRPQTALQRNLQGGRVEGVERVWAYLSGIKPAPFTVGQRKAPGGLFSRVVCENLPVLTPYFSVSRQSTRICSRDSGLSESSRLKPSMPSRSWCGWWKSSTLVDLSNVFLT